MPNEIKNIKPKKKRKKRTGPDVAVGKHYHIFNKRWNKKEIETQGDEMLEYFKSNNKAVHIVSFSTEKMLCRQQIYDFRDMNPYFAKCFKIVKDMIINRIMAFGLVGKNQAFAIFTLLNISEGEFKNKHEHEHSGNVTNQPVIFVEDLED